MMQPGSQHQVVAPARITAIPPISTITPFAPADQHLIDIMIRLQSAQFALVVLCMLGIAAQGGRARGHRRSTLCGIAAVPVQASDSDVS
jgi:hypothetical protein